MIVRCGPTRMNALAAVELDPVRLHDRWLDVRLAAAVLLAPRVDACEALLAGVTVPTARLDQRLARALELDGPVALDLDLAYRAIAQGVTS